MHLLFTSASCYHFNLYPAHLYQKRSFARKYSTKSWVFVTNVLNDLSPSMYLDYMSLTYD